MKLENLIYIYMCVYISVHNVHKFNAEDNNMANIMTLLREYNEPWKS
jgi:hypothetical protein